MPADEEAPRRRRALDKGRMESLQRRRVRRFAMTLLVLNVVLDPPGAPLHRAPCLARVRGVRHQLPDDRRRVARSHQPDRSARADRPDLAAAQLAPAARGGLPAVPDRARRRRPDNTSGERVYVTMYGLTLLAIRVLGAALDPYARLEHLYAPREDGEESHSPQRKLLPVVIGYMIAIVIGLALPIVAVAFYFGLAVYAIVPFRKVAGLLFGHSVSPFSAAGELPRPGPGALSAGPRLRQGRPRDRGPEHRPGGDVRPWRPAARRDRIAKMMGGVGARGVSAVGPLPVPRSKFGCPAVPVRRLPVRASARSWPTPSGGWRW